MREDVPLTQDRICLDAGLTLETRQPFGQSLPFSCRSSLFLCSRAYPGCTCVPNGAEFVITLRSDNDFQVILPEHWGTVREQSVPGAASYTMRIKTMREIPAIKVHQWLPEWDQVKFDDQGTRRRPPPHFYVFSLPANELQALSGIQRRIAEAGDTGIQRRLDPERTSGIQDYIRYGFPTPISAQTIGQNRDTPTPKCPVGFPPLSS